MPTFDESWSGNPRNIGALERGDHYFLSEADPCAFYGEYTAGAGWGHSSTNGLVANLKKKPSLRHTDQWRHKVAAMQTVAAALRASFMPANLGSICFVPMPPSKTKAHPEYDDRMELIARNIGAADVRPMLYATADREARHTSSAKREPDELRHLLAVDASMVDPQPATTIILDDMVTTGCGFMVAKEKLRAIWPATEIYGLFVARRVPPKLDFGEFELPGLG